MILALLFVAATCTGTKVEVHGTAAKSGRVEVYSAPGDVETSAGIAAGRPWSVCVDPTDHPINNSGPFVPWYVEVNYTYVDGTSRHERWRVPKAPKSVDVKTIVTDGALK